MTTRHTGRDIAGTTVLVQRDGIFIRYARITIFVISRITCKSIRIRRFTARTRIRRANLASGTRHEISIRAHCCLTSFYTTLGHGTRYAGCVRNIGRHACTMALVVCFAIARVICTLGIARNTGAGFTATDAGPGTIRVCSTRTTARATGFVIGTCGTRTATFLIRRITCERRYWTGHSPGIARTAIILCARCCITGVVRTTCIGRA